MIEKKLTQAELADAADCHEKTIQNLLNGRSVRDQTLFDVCMVLGLDFDAMRELWNGSLSSMTTPGSPGPAGEGGGIAPLYLGAYTRAAVDHYVGGYLTLRPAFSGSGAIVAYRTDIVWDAAWPSLVFEERERPDAPYAHRGRVHVPAASMFVHLVSQTKGAMRFVVVSQLDQTGHMRGLITTINRRGASLTPVSAPIVYVRRTDIDHASFGEIGRDDACHAAYRAILAATINEGYGRLVQA